MYYFLKQWWATGTIYNNFSAFYSNGSNFVMGLQIRQ